MPVSCSSRISSDIQNQFIDTNVYTVPASAVRNGTIVPRLLKNDLHGKIQTAIKATGLDKMGRFFLNVRDNLPLCVAQN